MTQFLDTRGMQCPIPILKARKHLNQLESQGELEISRVTDRRRVTLRPFVLKITTSCGSVKPRRTGIVL